MKRYLLLFRFFNFLRLGFYILLNLVKDIIILEETEGE